MTNLIVKRLFDKQIIKPCGPRASKNSQSIEYKLSDDQDYNLKSKSLIMASELVLRVKSTNMTYELNCVNASSFHREEETCCFHET